MDWTIVRGIIFDLDGTLYEDTNHFRYYSRLIKESLPRNLQACYEEDEARVYAGDHCVRIGRVYDRKNDLVLEMSDQGVVRSAFRWSGEEIDENSIRMLYPEPVQLDLCSIISIGDGWWIPAALGFHYGLESTYQAYVQTKEFLALDQTSITPISGVKELLGEHLGKCCSLVVATNSDKQDTRGILTRLGIESVFERLYTSCQKPKLTREVFRRVSSDLGIPFQNLLSIGDNYLNEIYPAKELGMQTCLIDPDNHYSENFADIVVKSISELTTTGANSQ